MRLHLALREGPPQRRHRLEQLLSVHPAYPAQVFRSAQGSTLALRLAPAASVVGGMAPLGTWSLVDDR
jgi:hypothetical protein